MWKVIKIVFLSFIGFLIFSTFVFIIWVGGIKEFFIYFRPMSTDAELMENFQTNRSKFFELQDMLKEDQNLIFLNYKRICVGPLDAYFCGSDSEFVSENRYKNTGISQSRIEKYRNLFDQLNIIGISTGQNRKEFVFTSFTESFFSVHSKTKGYRYIENKSENIDFEIKPSLDELSKIHGYRTGLREIESNWYIFFQGY